MSAIFNPTEIVFLAIATWGKWFFMWLMIMWAIRGIKSANARAKIISQLADLFHRPNSRTLPSDEPNRQTPRPADGRATTRRSRRRGRRGRRRHH
jgi:hypothetical protein